MMNEVLLALASLFVLNQIFFVVRDAHSHCVEIVFWDTIDKAATECFQPTGQITCFSVQSLAVLVCAVGVLSFLFGLFVVDCLWCFQQRRGHGEAMDEVRAHIGTPIEEEGPPHPMEMVC